jgi:hypothetical protein
VAQQRGDVSQPWQTQRSPRNLCSTVTTNERPCERVHGTICGMSNIAFPGTAETRAAYLSELTGTIESRAVHLRELSHHMQALELTNASLADVQTEAVELELAVSVYRRFAGEPGDVATSDATTAAGADGSAPKEGAHQSDPAPTFSQFALTHLSTPEGEAADGDGDQPQETVSQEDNGTRPSWLAPRTGRGA